MRKQGLEHAGIMHDAEHAKNAEGDEPDQGNGCEQGPDPARPMLLYREHAEQDQRRDRHDVMHRGGTQHLDALNGRKHRNRRRDHGIAKEQRSTEQADDHDDPTRVDPPHAALGQCHQGHHATLALVVGTQDEGRVLDGNDGDQRPEDQRKHTEHVLAQRQHAMHIVERLAEGIQRTRADVAVDNSNGEKAKREQAPAACALVFRGLVHAC